MNDKIFAVTNTFSKELKIFRLFIVATLALVSSLISFNHINKKYGSGAIFSTPPSYETIYYTIKKVESLFPFLTDQGLSVEDKNLLATTAKKHNLDLDKLKPGQKIEVVVDKNSDNLASLTIISQFDKILITPSVADSGYDITKKVIPIKQDFIKFSCEINGSLIESAKKVGVPMKNILEAISAHSYNVDFQREIQKGDKFNVIIERSINTNDGSATYGKTLFSSLVLKNTTYKMYRYKFKNGSEEFFDDSLNSIKKDLIKTPFPAAKISSNFGMRKHPLLGYSKMHKGVDFAAQTGTPILAAGKGTIVEIGKKSGYGNYIRIKHNNEYSTAYGHAKSFARGLKPGSNVQQGQVIAYVGSTGHSTGPHLHFEVLKGNKQINPLSVKASSMQKLSGKDAAKFKNLKRAIDSLILGNQPVRVALNINLNEIYSAS